MILTHDTLIEEAETQATGDIWIDRVEVISEMRIEYIE
jgi:hypothetical protein